MPMGEVVQEKCEADFLGKLDAARKAAYRRQLFVCDHKYAKQTGTMYRSFEAFRRAGAARDFAKAVREVSPRQPGGREALPTHRDVV